MVTCLRTVSNKLCSTNYLKIPSIVENSAINSIKIIQKSKPKYEKNKISNVPLANSMLAPNPFYCCNNVCISQYGFIPLTSSIISNDAKMHFYKTESQVPVNDSAFNDKHLLMSQKVTPKGDSLPENHGRPTEKQLNYIFEDLSHELPRIMSFPINPTIYRRDLIFEDNIRNKRTVGITKYVSQIAIIRVIAHLKYAHTRLVILKITKHPEEGTVKCRWRIIGIHFSEFLFRFWTFIPGRFHEKIDNANTWYDGFSIFYIGSDGLIYKHLIDKMMPDDDKVTANKSVDVTTKLAMFLGLAPKEEQLVFSSGKIEAEKCN